MQLHILDVHVALRISSRERAREREMERSSHHPAEQNAIDPIDFRFFRKPPRVITAQTSKPPRVIRAQTSQAAEGNQGTN
jgi:hypothetical protein